MLPRERRVRVVDFTRRSELVLSAMLHFLGNLFMIHNEDDSR